jgi:2-methylisocitrate lyase-like PEP mutase family enzyme
VYDALSSRIAQLCGFGAIYMTGYGTAASYGYPDLGLLTMSEMLENVRRIASAVDIPLIADADTGYGNPVNVYRTVREYEKAGAAAVQLEDQTWPKRCGFMEGKRVISSEEMVGKVKAAADARLSSETLLVIRTDALKTHGFEEAICRAEMYAEAGADILFVEAPTSEEQVRKIPKLLGKPCLLNMAFGKEPLSLKTVEEMGYAIVIYPTVALVGAVEGAFRMCTSLMEGAQQPQPADLELTFDQLNKICKLAKFQELERKFV